MAGYPIVHLEISAKDPAAASRFYSELCGWKIEVDPNFNYYQFVGEGGPGGGFVKVGDQDFKAGDVVPYVGADDIDAVLSKAEALGGRILMPKTEIPGIGWFAFFADPTGNRIGVYTGQGSQGGGQ